MACFPFAEQLERLHEATLHIREYTFSAESVHTQSLPILMENEEMGFYMPEEGTNMWVDCMVIPANAQNPKLAHEFINYLLDYDIAYTNSEWVGYTSPHKDVLTDLSSMGGYFEGNEAYVPRQGYEMDEVFEDNQVLKERLTQLWIKVKAGA